MRSAAFELACEPLVVPLDLTDLPKLALGEADLADRAGGPTSALRELLATQPQTARGMAALPTIAQLLVLREAPPPPPPPPTTTTTTTAASASVAHRPRRTLVLANTHLYFANPVS